MSVQLRIELEKKIARAAIRAIIASGYVITVDDGEGGLDCVSENNQKKIMDTMFNLDDCLLRVVNPRVGSLIGWVKFVFGNDGYDCLSDYTTNLEGILKKANDIAKKYA